MTKRRKGGKKGKDCGAGLEVDGKVRERERGRMDEEGLLGNQLDGGRAGSWAENIQVCWEGMYRGTEQAVEGGEVGWSPICFWT